MESTYTNKDVLKLNDELVKLGKSYEEETFSWLNIKLKPKASTYREHGLLRRLSMVIHSIERVYKICPPDVIEIEKEELNDITIFIQASLLNINGALDNIAHLLNYELALELNKHEIGFSSKCK